MPPVRVKPKAVATDAVQAEIGQRIRMARSALGISQEAAAAEAGIEPKRYQRLELGSVNATLNTLVRVAAALKTDFWTMIGARAPKADVTGDHQPVD